jgi:ABC-type transporter Mla MlaB component
MSTPPRSSPPRPATAATASAAAAPGAPTMRPPAAPAAAAVGAAGTTGGFAADALNPDSSTFPALYEAAILYAADHYDGTKEVLKEHLKTPEGKSNIRTWLTLFDFYQITGNRSEFDALSMLFTVKFERSPPGWAEAESTVDPRRKEKREHKDFFQFSPAADGSMMTEIDRFEAFIKQMGSARIDLGRIKAIEAEEAAIFAMLLQRIRRAKMHLWFNNFAALEALLKERINAAGTDKDHALGFWSFMFELYVSDGKLAEYEDLGLEYAVAFEMSPPAWETITRPTGAADEDDAPKPVVGAAMPVGFPLKGVFNLDSKDVAMALSVHASKVPEVVVDMGALMRIDFAAASYFFETIRSLQSGQKRIILSNLNELVAALLEVFGMQKHAMLMRKKTV